MLATMRNWLRPKTKEKTESPADAPPLEEPLTQINTIDLDLRPDDPFLAYLLSANGVVEIERLKLDSPALRQLKEVGVKISVPLVSQGELIGLLNLGAV